METNMAGLLGRGRSAGVWARPILAGALGLFVAACGGGGGGGGSGPVTGGSPPVMGGGPPVTTTGGPMLPQGRGDGSSYQASVTGSTFNTDSRLFQHGILGSSPDGRISFGSDQAEISTSNPGLRTVSLQNNDLVFDEDRVQSFQRPLQNPTFVAVLTRLDHVAFGSWFSVERPDLIYAGAAAGGIRTPGSEVPTSGSAVYIGGVNGVVVMPSATAMVAGSARLTADFGSRTIAGEFTGLRSIDTATAEDRPFNSISVSGRWMPGANTYSGGATVGVSPGGPSALPTGSSGPMSGGFFGSGPGAARETGGTFAIYAPDRASNGFMYGSFGARR